jgi:hypothetical protein
MSLISSRGIPYIFDDCDLLVDYDVHDDCVGWDAHDGFDDCDSLEDYKRLEAYDCDVCDCFGGRHIDFLTS